MFVRVSTNTENDFYQVAGGFDISNSIYDFEVQDNFSLGTSNDFSVGLNYRLVNFDIHNINSERYLNYIDPQASENLTGAFIQDKIKLMDEKLNFTLGIKAENYSLVNDKFYMSPMAKFSYIASNSLTFWGGFTQSYTTPGFNNTNIDWFLFQTPDQATWNQLIGPQVQQGVFDAAYQQAIAQGADDATATAAANAFVASPEGIAAIAQGVQDNSAPNIAVKNGSSTVPTQFRTFEAGFKSNLNDKIQFNTTFFKSFISDGIAVNPGDALQADQASISDPSRTTDYYLYGNYVKGETTGLEAMMRVLPTAGLRLEGSYSWSETDWEYQENDDFDVSTITSSPNTNPQFVPKGVYRFKVDYDFASKFNFTGSLIHATEFRTQNFYFYDTERYASPVETDVFGNRDGSTTISENSSRTIVNLRLAMNLMDDKLSTYIFGNDVTNSGIVADTDNLRSTTMSQIGAMYGVGLNLKLK